MTHRTLPPSPANDLNETPTTPGAPRAPEPVREPPTAEDVAKLPEILDKDQAAWLMRMTPRQLLLATRRGDIRVTKIGHSLLYSKSKLLAMVSGDALS